MPMRAQHQHGGGEAYWCFQPPHRAFSASLTTNRPILATSVYQAAQSLTQNRIIARFYNGGKKTVRYVRFGTNPWGFEAASWRLE